MTNELKKVICPCCGSTVYKAKFCVECGSRLEGAKPAGDEDIKTDGKKDDTAAVCNRKPKPFFFVQGQDASSDEPQRKALSDKGLTLLVNTCRKTLATVGGDGYSEIVLYQDESTGEYWLHTYSKYVYMKEEAHASYTATPELAERVMSYIKEHDLASWKNNRGIPLCGGDYVIRFRHGSGVIRLNSGNMNDGSKAYTEINGMLYAEATEENRRYAEQ